MSWVLIVLLAGAAAVLVGAEWPRLAALFGRDARAGRARARRKRNLRVLPTEPRNETEEFEASVQRDLLSLPTTKERDPKR